MESNKLNSIVGLREELADLYKRVKNDEVDRKVATTLTLLAGKMITSARAQVEYAVARKEKPYVEFLE